MRYLILIPGLLAVPAFALVVGGSNLGILGYPEPECQEPFRPNNLLNLFSRENYQQQTNEYLECLDAYIDNAENDLERVEQALDEAVDAREAFANRL